jgi:type VI secretion system protein ImpH
MRSERWWQEASVIQGLFNNPKSFEFVQAVRLLRHESIRSERHWSSDFNFSSSLNLNFPLNEIESLELKDHQIQLTNLIVGLTGMQGVLPYSYTNKIKLSGRQQRDETLKFLTLFNHKLTSQYVDASINYHLPIRYEIENENSYLDIIHALNGYIRDQHEQPDLDDYFAEFSGLMQGQSNNVYALKTMLCCIFGFDFSISEFLPEKFKLETEQKTCLGGKQSSLLGLNTFCGETVSQIDEKIEIEIGPLNQKEYLQFLPNQTQSNKLKRLLESWCSPTLQVDIRLKLKKQEQQAVRLGSDNPTGLSQGAFLMPLQQQDNTETCYALIGRQQ